MNNEKLWLVLQIQENNKWYAWVRAVYSNENIASIISDINPEFANIYTTKKEAMLHCEHANACYHANGFYMFEPLLRRDL